MNLWDILIVAAVAAIAGISLWRRKKHGSCCDGGCGCGCESCPKKKA